MSHARGDDHTLVTVGSASASRTRSTRDSDAGVRAACTRIAADEAEHVELSFDIDAWLAPLLTAEERRQVDAAKAHAWLALEASCDVAAAPEVVAIAGIPSPADAHGLLAALVWAVAQEAA